MCVLLSFSCYYYCKYLLWYTICDCINYFLMNVDSDSILYLIYYNVLLRNTYYNSCTFITINFLDMSCYFYRFLFSFFLYSKNLNFVSFLNIKLDSKRCNDEDSHSFYQIQFDFCNTNLLFIFVINLLFESVHVIGNTTFIIESSCFWFLLQVFMELYLSSDTFTFEFYKVNA